MPASGAHNGGPCDVRLRLDASDVEYQVLACVLVAAGKSGAERLSPSFRELDFQGLPLVEAMER